MSNVQCGISEVKKGKRLGSMEECAKKKQIRLFGIHKIDARLLESLQKKKVKISDSQRGKLYDKLIKLKTKIKKLMEKKKSVTDKTKIEKEIEKIKSELVKIMKKIQAVEKKTK